MCTWLPRIIKCYLDECYYNENEECICTESIELDEQGQCTKFIEKD